MMNPTLTADFFDIVLHTRLESGRNMWSDMLEMDLIYIICGWNLQTAANEILREEA